MEEINITTGHIVLWLELKPSMFQSQIRHLVICEREVLSSPPPFPSTWYIQPGGRFGYLEQIILSWHELTAKFISANTYMWSRTIIGIKQLIKKLL
jgi:hypothetical protein